MYVYVVVPREGQGYRVCNDVHVEYLHIHVESGCTQSKYMYVEQEHAVRERDCMSPVLLTQRTPVVLVEARTHSTAHTAKQLPRRARHSPDAW